ncbi:MAG: hypothetical protein CVU55_02660 [Deltaproteobacteria bacterium HGW-Deltaproteobacteria-13]|nr:MAG: hypothetical protein CVU55_02660 [Deltaproteobacteria bacterium HGW-Deltaproteobacteria-13]
MIPGSMELNRFVSQQTKKTQTCNLKYNPGNWVRTVKNCRDFFKEISCLPGRPFNHELKYILLL